MFGITSWFGLNRKPDRLNGDQNKPNTTAPKSLYGFICAFPPEIRNHIVSPRDEWVKDIFQSQKQNLNQADPKAQRAGAKKQALKINLLTRHSVNKNNENNRFLRESLIRNHLPLFDALLQTTDNPDLPDLIKLAACRKDEGPLRKLLTKVKEPLPLDVLQWVAECGQPESLNTLLEKAPADLSPTEQATLIRTAQRQEAEIIRLKGLSVDENNAVLRSAFRFENPDRETKCRQQVLALLRAGAERGDDGASPLHPASFRGKKALVKLLLQAGADVNAKNSEGTTPLHVASRYGNEAVVKLLLQDGANVNAVNSDGKTPLHRAALEGHEAIVNLLRQHGAEE